MIRPNLVFSTLDIVLNILVLASLSFLGLGVQPPTAEWGLMVAEGQTFLLTAWWISTLPGLVIVLSGVGFSLMGDGLAVPDRSGTTGQSGRERRDDPLRGGAGRVSGLQENELAPLPVAPALPLLEVRGLHTAFPTGSGSVLAATDVKLRLAERETRGLVGESGSGKSVTLLSLLGLVPAPGRVIDGEVLFGGRDLVKLSPNELRAIRGREIAMIFQDPTSCLNPVYTVGDQIAETLRVKLGMGGRAARGRAAELLDHVGIPAAKERLGAYPHELSGGMRQRVMIAIAIACRPRLLLADEPTTALDVTVQDQILRCSATSSRSSAWR